MFQFHDRNLEKMTTEEDRVNVPKREIFFKFKMKDEGEKWYKRLFGRIFNWIKKPIFTRRSNNSFKSQFKDQNAVENGSAESIPQSPVEEVESKGEDLSPTVGNETWKADAQLILKGCSEEYTRFKQVKPANFLEKYILKSMIGQGSFGFVLKAERSRDSKPVAIKFIYRPSINPSNWLFDAELGSIPSEVYYLKNLSHRGIVQFLDYFEDGRYVYLVTELHGTSWDPKTNPKLNLKCNPGLKETVGGNAEGAPCDLFECIEAHKQLPESTIHYIFTQLLGIVTYLLDEGIVHRDLKDENIVVDEGYRIKIVDFGCATRIPWTGFGPTKEEAWFEKFNGTLAFAPPEVIRGSRYRATEAEMWTLGVLLYTMVFRQAPFQDSQSIIYGQLEFPYEEDRPGILDLIRKLLAKNPQQRLKHSDLLRHPWIIRKSLQL